MFIYVCYNLNNKELNAGDIIMGFLGDLIVKGITTAARNSTIKVIGDATVDVIAAAAQKEANKDDSVVKNGKLYIKPTRSSENYINENALEIARELLGVGFENITLKPVKKLGQLSAKKYGKIHSISINGKDEFLGIKKVPASSYILIEFLDFKDNVDREVYKNVSRIKSGKIQKDLDAAAIVENNCSSRKFCSYCGEVIIKEDAKFCSACGKEI